jgi:hypothetical protein
MKASPNTVDDLISMDSKKLAALPSSSQHGTLKVSDATTISTTSRNVLRGIQNTEGLHKLSTLWEGPFSVAKVTGPGSYRLQTLEGNNVSNLWNIDQLCRFYV